MTSVGLLGVGCSVDRAIWFEFSVLIFFEPLIPKIIPPAAVPSTVTAMGSLPHARWSFSSLIGLSTPCFITFPGVVGGWSEAEGKPVVQTSAFQTKKIAARARAVTSRAEKRSTTVDIDRWRRGGQKKPTTNEQTDKYTRVQKKKKRNENEKNGRLSEAACDHTRSDGEKKKRKEIYVRTYFYAYTS